MNILEENKSCFKDCFYSFSRVDVRSVFLPSHSHSVPFFFGFHFPISAFFCSNRSLSFPVELFFFYSFVVFLLCSSSPFLFSLLFSRFPFLIEKIAFTLHGRPRRGVHASFFLPKRAVSSRGDFTKFPRCRESVVLKK